MFSLSRVLSAVGLLALAVGPVSMAPAFAQSVPVAQTAPATSSVVSGLVTDTSASPVSGAVITLTGAQSYTARSDASGLYAFPAVVPGVYTATVSRTGYQTGTEQAVAVVAGTPYTLNIQLAQPTLTSLKVIGSTRTSFSRSTFNVSPASVNVVSTQTFIEQGQPQVKNILNQTPGIVISLPATSGNGASPGAITFPNIRGGLSFETASLIDGHPVSVGAFGDYVSTFLNSFQLQSVEVVKGPGANAPQVNYAIGGTVNFRTLDPTRTPSGYETIGMDSFGGTFTNLGYSNTIMNGKLGFVFDYAVDGTPGPLNNYQTFAPVNASYLINGQPILSSPRTNGTFPGTSQTQFNKNVNLLYSGLPISTTYTGKSELAKIRINFSNVTALTASYLGSQTWTEQNGNHFYQELTNFTPGGTYNSLTGPQAGPLLIEDNIFPPQHEYEINNEPIFQAEVRTSFMNNNILARAYSASISRLQYNGLDNPSQPGFIPGVQLFGPVMTCTLNPVPKAGCPAANQVTTTYNGQTVDLTAPGAYFNDSEEDRLHGYSIEIDHPFGDSGNTLSIADDFTQSTTGKYNIGTFIPGPTGSNATVPPTSGQKFNTFLLRYIGNIGPRLNLTFSNYFNNYLTHYSTDNGLTFKDQDNSHYDARLGLTYRVDPNTSLRASAGSSIAPPYIGLYSVVNTPPIIDKSGVFAANTQANPAIRPETAFGYDFGADVRLGKDHQTLLSGDIYLTNLWNQLIGKSTYAGGFATVPGLPLGAGGVGTGPPVTVPLFSSGSTNLARARYEGIEVSIRRDPAIGFGFTAQAALQQATPVNVPLAFYTLPGGTVPVRNLGVVPGANFYGGQSGQGISNQPVPYSQGYGELRYRFPKGGLISFGETYYGSNNSLFVPAFFVANGNLSLPVGNGFTLNMNVDNVFNTNGSNFVYEYQGLFQPFIPGAQAAIGPGGSFVPIYGAQQNANTYGPRNVRFSLSYRVGGGSR